MRLLSCSAACMLAFAAPAALAQSLRPGLWEVERSTRSASGDEEKRAAAVQQRMANLPPEKRKLMEEMMARNGVKAGSTGSLSARVCITPEMAQRNELPEGTVGGCQTTTQSRTASGVKLAFTCTNPPQSGETEVSYTGGEAYSTRTTVHAQVNGKPDTVTRTGSGRWLAADCGSVPHLPAQR